MNDRRADEEGFGLQPDGAEPYSLPMEARVAVLEEIARNTEKLLAKMDARMDRMETHAIQMEERLNARIAETNQRMAEMEARLVARMDAMEARLTARMDQMDIHSAKMEERLTARMEQMEANAAKSDERAGKRMAAIEDRQINDFRWMLGLGLSAVAFVFAVVAHGFHWF